MQALDPPSTCKIDDVPVVSNQADAFAWAEDYLKVLQASDPHAFHRLSEVLTSDVITYSTAFSGIDAPGCAAACIASTFAWMTGRQPARFVHESAIEVNVKCQKELANSPTGPKTLYGDILSFFKEPLRSALANATHALESLIPLTKQADLIDLVQLDILSKSHVRLGRSRYHWAGLPCVNWSPAGDRQGTSGYSMATYAAWTALRRCLVEDVVVVECSHLFSTSVLETLIGDLYNISHHVWSATHHGWPCRRARYWAVCTSRDWILKSQPLPATISLLYRHSRITWHELLKVDDEQQAADDCHELAWASSRRKSRLFQIPLADIQAFDKPFLATLTQVEKDNYDNYVELYKNKGDGVLDGKCFSLGQSVKNGFPNAAGPKAGFTEGL
jgi:hypothetical protein